MRQKATEAAIAAACPAHGQASGARPRRRSSCRRRGPHLEEPGPGTRSRVSRCVEPLELEARILAIAASRRP
jgi:hypothetical protein